MAKSLKELSQNGSKQIKALEIESRLERKQDMIRVRGAREHNLQNISVDIPRDSLTVITGVSGSGKSSLAFSTIYSEGQRRYLESLSAYARQFLQMMEKPDVDHIEGLSPAISIDQKTTSKNPRSTVATVTEVYDYLRLLFARVGRPHCPVCGIAIEGQSPQQIVERVMRIEDGTKFTVNAPVVRGRKGEFKDLLERLRGEGFVRVKVDGQIRNLEEDIKLDKKYKHDIDVVVDRLVMREEVRSRLNDSVETAAQLAEGLVKIDLVDKSEALLFSEQFACPEHGVGISEMEPRIFSFNAPQGACTRCTGLGFQLVVDEELLIDDPSLSIEEGALGAGSMTTATFYDQMIKEACKKLKISMSTPWENLPRDKQESLLYGGKNLWISVSYKNFRGRHRSYGMWFEGVITYLESKYERTESDFIKERTEELMSMSPCPDCKGARLQPEVLAVTVGGLSIHQVTELSIEDALEFIVNLELDAMEMEIGRRILKELKERLTFLNDVGVGYLTLNRSANTLSGGEAQRLRLGGSVSQGLQGVLFVLDEPSIGISARDNDRLIKTLKNLRDTGNTVLVVEHDEDTQKAADYLVDMGPGAGEHGGRVVASGTPGEVMKNPNSITGQYLSGKRFIAIPKRRKDKKGSLKIKGARQNNLKNISVEFPVGKFIGVSGVSGSGKSTLVNEILYKGVAQGLKQARIKPGQHKSIEGLDNFDKVIDIDQSPIGRTPRSNPVTYTKTFDHIRDLFAQTPDARARGYKQGRFSFNVRGGRCEVCRGEGELKKEMHFLPDIFVRCDACHGTRYNRETLEVRFKGKNISDVLNMTVEEALEFFKAIPKIKRRLQTISDVGLEYIRLGQPATTLSGGEAQRVKLASELQKIATGKTLYILDEPSVGLASSDIEKLLATLQRLVDQGNTVVVIEHNLDILKVVDHLIDLGPEGGDGGGRLLACGTPEQVAECEDSWTGKFLKSVLEQTNRFMRKAPETSKAPRAKTQA